ncbi:hypothetical protein ACHAXT_010152 [Thalassiosira profunda]
MSDSDSSDDVPLAALAGKKSESDEELEFDEDAESEEEELVADDPVDSDDFIVEEEEDDEDEDYASDSSDDVPLSALKSKKAPPPKKKPKKAKAKPAKKATSAKKKAAPKKKKASAKKSKSKASAAKSATSTYLCASGQLYANCNKGKLIQSLLSRWWYAYQWPDPQSLPASTPSGYDALDGFPGVYICTRGAQVGKFLDKRDHAKAPSFNNFAKKGAEELQGMLLKAIEGQRKDLVKHEGEGTATEKGLTVLENWTRKLNAAKADKEAEKVLKASRLTLK